MTVDVSTPHQALRSASPVGYVTAGTPALARPARAPQIRVAQSGAPGAEG